MIEIMMDFKNWAKSYFNFPLKGFQENSADYFRKLMFVLRDLPNVWMCDFLCLFKTWRFAEAFQKEN